MSEKEAPIGESIQGTTTAPAPVGLGGKPVSLNLVKCAYFRFSDREDFELNKLNPTGTLPKDLSSNQYRAITRMIARGELVRGTKVGQISRKKLDRIKPYMLFLQQSRNFTDIKRRVTEVVAMGGNVSNSGYGAREVIEMMMEQEIEGHARSDVLNLLDTVHSKLPGANKPHDEPGSHALAGSLGQGGKEIQSTQAKPGTRSAREAIAKRADAGDISTL